MHYFTAKDTNGQQFIFWLVNWRF